MLKFFYGIYLTTIIHLLYLSGEQEILFSCKFDKCNCCYNKSQSELTNNSKHIEYNDNQIINTTFFLNSTVKQISSGDYVSFRRCTDTNYFDQYNTLKQKVVNEWSSDFSNGYVLKPLDYCLIKYCEQSHRIKRNAIECSNDDILDLTSDYVNRRCFQTIQFISIRSRQLRTVGNGGFLADHKVNWTIMELDFDYGMFSKIIEVDCNAFQFLKHLRVLKINVLGMANFKCILNFNPNLAVFLWRGIHIWNTCGGQLAIWVHGEQYSEIDFYQKIIKTFNPYTIIPISTTRKQLTKAQRRYVFRQYYLGAAIGIVLFFTILIYLQKSSYIMGHLRRFWQRLRLRN